MHKIENVLRYLGGVEQYGVLSLCLFCGIFLGVLLFAFLQKKNHLDRMARVPLDGAADDLHQPEPRHE